MRALGGEPTALPGRDLAALCSVLADPGVSDRSKLALLVGRVPPHREEPLAELVRRIEGDAETRALLETIGDDERMSLRWLREMGETLAHDGA